MNFLFEELLVSVRRKFSMGIGSFVVYEGVLVHLYLLCASGSLDSSPWNIQYSKNVEKKLDHCTIFPGYSLVDAPIFDPGFLPSINLPYHCGISDFQPPPLFCDGDRAFIQ